MQEKNKQNKNKNDMRKLLITIEISATYQDQWGLDMNNITLYMYVYFKTNTTLYCHVTKNAWLFLLTIYFYKRLL